MSSVEEPSAPRLLKIATAQVGAIHKWDSRSSTLQWLVTLLEKAAKKGAQLVLFPETTFTTFFPRYFISEEQELDQWFEHGEDITKSEKTAPLFRRAIDLNVDICVGYAEKTADQRSFNTCIYFSAHKRQVIKKYRKSHLPGTKEPYTDPGALNQLEKRYFEEGEEGFEAFRVPDLLCDAWKSSAAISRQPSADGKGDPIFGLLICNDRRWCEAWRVYGLQGVELMLCGYTSTAWNPQLYGTQNVTREKFREDAYFYHKLVMQSNSYMNSCFSMCAARSGLDDNTFPLIGGSCIVAPNGRVIADAQTEGDEIVFAEIDLADCRPGKETTFNFGKHRRPELYKMISNQKGVAEPPLLPD